MYVLEQLPETKINTLGLCIPRFYYDSIYVTPQPSGQTGIHATLSPVLHMYILVSKMIYSFQNI